MWRAFNNKETTAGGILLAGQWSAGIDFETPGSCRHSSEVAEWDVIEVILLIEGAPT